MSSTPSKSTKQRGTVNDAESRLKDIFQEWMFRQEPKHQAFPGDAFHFAGVLRDGRPPLYAQYTIGGTVVGLAGDNLVLENNGSNQLTINWDESFTFAGTVPSGTAYNITISNLPSNPGQMCAVANGNGTVTSSVNNIIVTCFSVSGTVSGLPPGESLTLQYDQNISNISIPIPSDGVFTFPPVAAPTTEYVAPTTMYNITVAGTPLSWGHVQLRTPATQQKTPGGSP